MPRRDRSAPRWSVSYMSAQEAPVLGDGAEPPPLRTDPRPEVARSLGVTTLRSACVICPIFSSSDIRASRSFTRAATGCDASLYGGAWPIVAAGADNATNAQPDASSVDSGFI